METNPHLQRLMENQQSLPIDWDASGLMSLSEIYRDNEATLAPEEAPKFKLSPEFRDLDANVEKTPPGGTYSSMPDLSYTHGSEVPTTAKRNAPISFGSGPLTPYNADTGGRMNRLTLKEYEDQLDSLKQENFNLKIRILHLEGGRYKYSDNDGTSGKELIALQAKTDELTTALKEKDFALQQSKLKFNQLVRSHKQELEDLKVDCDLHLESVERQLHNHIASLENDLRLAKEANQILEFDNRRLDAMAIPSSRSSVVSAGDSFSEASLLSSRERMELELKARIADMEARLQNRPLCVNSATSPIPVPAEAIDRTLSATEYATLLSDDDRSILLAQCEEKEAIIEEKTSIINGLTKQLNELKRAVSNNRSDDEKLRKLEKELLNERETAMTRNKIIQGLVKVINKDKPMSQNDANVQTSSLSRTTNEMNETADLDSSTFLHWLNETINTNLNGHDDLFRRRLAEFQTFSESMYARLKQIADQLEGYTHQLPFGTVNMDASSQLDVLTREVASFRREFCHSLLDATVSITAAVSRAADDRDISERVQPNRNATVNISRHAAQGANVTDFEFLNQVSGYIDDVGGAGDLAVSNLITTLEHSSRLELKADLKVVLLKELGQIRDILRVLTDKLAQQQQLTLTVNQSVVKEFQNVGTQSESRRLMMDKAVSVHLRPSTANKSQQIGRSLSSTCDKSTSVSRVMSPRKSVTKRMHTDEFTDGDRRHENIKDESRDQITSALTPPTSEDEIFVSKALAIASGVSTSSQRELSFMADELALIRERTLMNLMRQLQLQDLPVNTQMKSLLLKELSTVYRVLRSVSSKLQDISVDNEKADNHLLVSKENCDAVAQTDLSGREEIDALLRRIDKLEHYGKAMKKKLKHYYSLMKSDAGLETGCVNLEDVIQQLETNNEKLQQRLADHGNRDHALESLLQRKADEAKLLKRQLLQPEK